MKTVFLKISNTEIYFNETDSIPVGNTTIPSEHIDFNTEYKDIFWEVELLKFDSESKVLSVRVIDYNPQNIGSFKSQKSKFPFFKILFEILDWKQVENQLSSYTISQLEDFFFGLPNSKKKESRDSSWTSPNFYPPGPKEFIPYSNFPTEKDAEIYAFKRRVEEVLRLNIHDFHFHDGFASASKVLKNPAVEIKIEIHNSTFRSEFEYIKDYFIKYLGRKTVKVFIDYMLSLDEITDLNCKCPGLEGINDSVIEAIKVKRTNILRKPNQKETRSILDLEEIFHVMNDPSAGKNVFNQSEEDIIDHFINIEGIRNKQQLSFLAYDLHQSTEKIRFTIHPNFGFVFSYITNNKSYFIWELLNSHATYIWYVENSIMSKNSLYSEFEKAVEYIKGLGRSNYKQAYKEGIINSNIQFKLLYHNRTEASGFKGWQEKLNSLIN